MFRRLAAAAIVVAACISWLGACFTLDSTTSTTTRDDDAGFDPTQSFSDGSSDAADANEAAAAPPCAMVSWWTGDDTLADKLGANDLAAGDGAAPTYAQGKVASGFSFDGTRAYAKSAPAGLDGLKQLTVEGWVKLAACGSATRRLVDHTTDGTNAGFSVDFLEDGTMRARVGEVQASVGGFANDILLHVAATYDGQTVVLYVNGIEGGRAAGAGAVDVPNADVPLTIGSSANGSSRYCGLADEVALYGRALSGADIASIYANGPTARCTN